MAAPRFRKIWWYHIMLKDTPTAAPCGIRSAGGQFNRLFRHGIRTPAGLCPRHGPAHQYPLSPQPMSYTPSHLPQLAAQMPGRLPDSDPAPESHGARERLWSRRHGE